MARKPKEVAEKPKAKRGRPAKTKEVKEVKTKSKAALKAELINDVDLIGVDALVGSSEKQFNLVSGSGALGKRQSTGLLAIDITLRGGLAGGSWLTAAGAEQSAKTTFVIGCIAQMAVDKSCPIIQFWDYEGSTSQALDYVENICRARGFKGSTQELFGVIDPETGKYLVKPIIRKYSETVLEKFFNNIKKIAKALPDKVERNGKWYQVFDPNKKDPLNSTRAELADQKLLKETGKYWIESNDNIQAIFVVDSYPAMLPNSADEKEEGGDGLAAQARAFSEQLKRVKGYFSSKRITVLGINQMRKVPMAMYGPSEEEPCGQALRFYSDVRLKFTPRSSMFGSKGKTEEEKSVTTKGKDIYRYINVKQLKNKLSIPDQETWVRIWVRDAKGKAWGHDLVFDSYYFMKQVGLLTSTENKKRIKFKDMEIIGVKDWNEKTEVPWLDLKRLILGDKKLQAETFKSLGYKGKPFNLRQKLVKYCATDAAYQRYMDVLISGAKDNESDED